MRVISRLETGAKTSIIRPPGAIQSPASSMVCPSPKPVAFGICSSWGTTIACAIIPKPTATAARLVSSTGRCTVTRRSHSGSVVRSS